MLYLDQRWGDGPPHVNGRDWLHRRCRRRADGHFIYIGCGLGGDDGMGRGKKGGAEGKAIGWKRVTGREWKAQRICVGSSGVGELGGRGGLRYGAGEQRDRGCSWL